MIRFMGSSDTLGSRFVQAKFYATQNLQSQGKTCPFPLIRLDRVDNSENEVQGPIRPFPKAQSNPNTPEKRPTEAPESGALWRVRGRS